MTPTIRTGGEGGWLPSCCDLPLAAAGWDSYRYAGPFGWIMIGARDHDGALKEARRSTDDRVSFDKLQVWDGAAYAPVSA